MNNLILKLSILLSIILTSCIDDNNSSTPRYRIVYGNNKVITVDEYITTSNNCISCTVEGRNLHICGNYSILEL